MLAPGQNNPRASTDQSPNSPLPSFLCSCVGKESNYLFPCTPGFQRMSRRRLPPAPAAFIYELLDLHLNLFGFILMRLIQSARPPEPLQPAGIQWLYPPPPPVHILLFPPLCYLFDHFFSNLAELALIDLGWQRKTNSISPD